MYSLLGVRSETAGVATIPVVCRAKHPGSCGVNAAVRLRGRNSMQSDVLKRLTALL